MVVLKFEISVENIVTDSSFYFLDDLGNVDGPWELLNFTLGRILSE